MAFSIWSSYMPTGGTLALLLAPLALGSFGWRGFWLALAVYAALCALLVARSVPQVQVGGGIGSLRLLVESILRPGSLALCLGFICYVGQWNSLMTWLPTYVVEERGAASRRPRCCWPRMSPSTSSATSSAASCCGWACRAGR